MPICLDRMLIVLTVAMGVEEDLKTYVFLHFLAFFRVFLTRPRSNLELTIVEISNRIHLPLRFYVKSISGIAEVPQIGIWTLFKL